MDVKEPKVIKKYVCAYKCKSSFRSRKKALEHHKICWSNPNNNTCVTCVFGERHIENTDKNFFNLTTKYRTCNSNNQKAVEFFEKNYKEGGEINNLDLPIENCPYHTSSRNTKIEKILNN